MADGRVEKINEKEEKGKKQRREMVNNTAGQHENIKQKTKKGRTL